MTLSDADREALHQRLEGSLGRRLQRIFERSTEGEIHWDHDVWSAVLDWMEGPLRRSMLYGPNVPEDKRGERNPAYQSFEIFDRARLQGVLENGRTMAVVLAAILELQGLEADFIRLLKLRATEEPSGAA